MEPGVGVCVFCHFLAYDFGEEDPDSAGRNSRTKNTVARDARMERNLASQNSNLVKNPRSRMKEFMSGI